MLQLKDIEWLNKKNKTHLYPLYKRLISDQKTESEEMEKDIPCKQKQKKSDVAILISDTKQREKYEPLNRFRKSI